MKIRPNLINSTQPNDKTALRQTYSARPERSSSTAAAGSVQLSATARALQQLQDNSNDIHTERVQALKSALASGDLQINPEAIADGLLNSAKELIK